MTKDRGPALCEECKKKGKRAPMCEECAKLEPQMLVCKKCLQEKYTNVWSEYWRRMRVLGVCKVCSTRQICLRLVIRLLEKKEEP